GYAQKNPKQEYKREAFALFQDLLENIKRDVVRILSHVQVRQPEEVERMEEERRAQAERQQMNYEHAQSSGMEEEQETANTGEQAENAEPFKRETPKVGRNDPCPCGSGKKYKQCHGKLS
ncbi:SEC-C metal-binding domain-containing protein, partial [Stutzerimonas frequens]|uniref:SEC-C metal-binding domain-containing protein n=1 Tax=Stutzerimonas frequens TaxID=2968969 RepID=UPI0022DD5C1C